MPDLLLSESDRVALTRVSRVGHVPDGATICTVTSKASEVSVNCAGFSRQFRSLPLAAEYLKMPWEKLEPMLGKDSSVILIRRDSGQWRPSSEEDRAQDWTIITDYQTATE